MIRVISHSDIASKAISEVICAELAKYNQVIYLTATAVLRDIRSNEDEFAKLERPIAFLSIQDFENQVRRLVYTERNCLSTADQRYILSRVIEHYFRDDSKKYNSYYSIRYELFTLFNNLQFSDISISSEMVEKIGLDYSEVEKTIFDIYRHYCEAIYDVVGNRDEEDKKNELIFSLIEKPKSDFNTFAAKQKDYIKENIGKCDAVFLDGFLFFNELQSFIIRSALECGKPVYIISKQFADGTGRFILNDALKAVSNGLENDYELIECASADEKKTRAIDVAKKYYPDIFIEAEERKAVDLSDGSIRFISPFVNREEELRFVVRTISKKLCDAYDGTVESIYSSLSDIAIVTAVSKTHYEQRISDLLADVGVFILNEKYADCFDRESIGMVYFDRAEFLGADIRDSMGKSLSFEEKLAAFSKCFHKIEVNNHIRPINSYPVSRFVLRLYEMTYKGFSVEGFKEILYSNWRYCTGETSIKWSQFISDFKYIELWFSKSNQAEEWISILSELIKAKEEIKDNPFYHYHPLNAVKMESLHFFSELLIDLNALLTRIINVKGSIEQHVSVLKDVVMKADSVVEAVHDNDFEQAIIKRLINTLSDICGSSIVNDVSARFFAENIRAMLNDYENEADEDESPLKLSVVNLENMKQFGTSFFIMCEADHYPRAYDNSFPYTDEIVSVLANPQYGICAVPSNKFGIEYHLQLERYLLKNVLDFTRDELIITYTEKEAGNSKGISVFAENLATMFDSDIMFETNRDENEISYDFDEHDERSIFFTRKEKCTVTDLAIFKFCPRLYYHKNVDEQSAYTSRVQLRAYLEAILFCVLMRRFMDYNTENKKVYGINDRTYLGVLSNLAREVVNENGRFFPFFSKYEIEDAGKNAHRKVLSSIENSKQYIKGNSFTLINYKDSVYRGDGYTVTVEHDNRFVDYEKKTWRMSQNSSYLEFLVLKTNSRKSELVHYADMIKALDENDADEDRINLVSRIIAKINIQFDSKRFAADGIKRTDQLVREIEQYDFLKAESKPSNYCNYCRLRTICMGK